MLMLRAFRDYYPFTGEVLYMGEWEEMNRKGE